MVAAQKPQLSEVECAIRVAIERHIDRGPANASCRLSMVVFPPEISDHLSFVCSCGKQFAVSRMEALTFSGR